MIGPYIRSPFEYFCISPVGLSPKKEPGKFWLIQDLSSAKGGISINSNIAERKGTVTYAGVPTALDLI